MVDPVQLSLDILSNTISLVLPGALWAVLFLIAWEHGPFADSLGLGRWTFWLLLPGALLASFALLPIAPISDDWLAVSFAGTLFPLLIGALAFGRAAPPRGRSLGQFLAFLTVESASLFLLVLPVSHPIGATIAPNLPGDVALDLAVVVVSTVWGGVALALFRGRPNAAGPGGRTETPRVIGFTLALTTAVLASTFVSSAAIPAVGIVEQFPLFLFPPLGAGVLAALLAPRVFPGREGFALPTAYFATTFGVLLGADLLRQPPLYGSGPAGLYTIGGAGVLDLVYLSGLIALGAAYLGHRVAGRSLEPQDGAARSPGEGPTPLGLLVLSFRAGARGRLDESVSTAAKASRASAERARRLLDVPEPPGDRPWQGLPVPGWVVADQANLDALARAGTTDPREGFRAWLMARWLVYLGRDLGIHRFGTLGARVVGFLVDLAVMVVPALGVWSLLALTTPGGLAALLTSVAFSAAIYGFVAVGFLYLVLSETLTGASVGKRASGLAVRDWRMRPPSLFAALVRNVSLLPMLTVVGLGGALAIAFVLKPTTLGSVVLAGVSLPAGLLALAGVLAFTFGGVVLLGAMGLVVIAFTAERQRVGDLWAGTWVVRAPRPSSSRVRLPPPGASGPGPFG